MPFVIPTTTGPEGLVLDGLDLSQGEGGSIRLKAFTPPIPKKRQEWVTASDSDGAILPRVPLRDNGQASVTVQIYGVSRDDANTTIGTIIDKLEEADRNTAGLPLVWTPGGSTPNLTFYVLSGEITEMPVDWESGYMVNVPEVSFTLDCAPYGYGDPVTYTGTATAGPLVTLELADVPGDVPGLGTLTVTEASSQNRRTVEWGAEQRYYDPGSPWPLIIDSDSLVTSGFAGTQTTRAGAYDPGASGNSIITSAVASAPQAICGTGVQPHIGTFRVKARIYSVADPTDLYVSLSWRAGDGAYTPNDPAHVDWSVRFGELDLGLITIPPASTGTQSWDGFVQAYSAQGGDTLEVDYLMLIPVEAGYGKSVASYSYSPGVITARDSFAGLGSGTGLSGRTPDAGSAWVTSGVATDFVGDTSTSVTVTTQPRVIRTTLVAEAEARAGALGSAMTDQRVEVTAFANVNAASIGAVARYVDDDNYLWMRVRAPTAGGRYLELVKKVSGTESTISTVTLDSTGHGIAPYANYFNLTVFSTGRAVATLSGHWSAEIDVTDTVLATGGTLASGKGGIADQALDTNGVYRRYDDIVVSIPPAEPIVLYSGRSLKVSHDRVQRESSGGGTWGPPQTSRGRNRFYVQPAGDADRTTRVAVKASRNDLNSAEDANLTDQITLTATVTPRYVFIPRP